MKNVNLCRRFIWLIAAVFAMGLLIGCGADSDDDWDYAAEADWDEAEMVAEDEGDDWDDDVEWAAEVADEDDEEVAAPRTAEEAEEEPEGGVLGAIPMLLPSESGRQLVYTVELRIETTEFTSGLRMLMDATADLDGYSVRITEHGRSLRTPDKERHADLSLRIPNENLLAFLTFIDDNLQVYNREFWDKELDDITFAYERTADNLETLREQEQRILDELDDDENEESDVTADDLAEVREQIRDLEETNIVAQRNVDYSDVALRLKEVILLDVEPEEPEEPEIFSDRLQSAAESSLNGLLGILQNILLFIIIILPWLFLIALFVVPIVYLVRRYKKNASGGILYESNESGGSDVNKNKPNKKNGSDKSDDNNGSHNPLMK